MHASALSTTPLATTPDFQPDSVTALVPGATTWLAHLSNEDLLTQTRYLVGKSNQILAALLEHLAEVEARGLHRERACASLYSYCIYELRFSEDAASRRASAARWVRRFPALLEAVARGELHLTGLLMVAPLLTDENQVEVLGRAKFRTKKELGKLVRRLSPLPPVPDRIEPLGPPLPAAPHGPTWAEFVESLAPPVRDLRPGERPSEWASDTAERELVQRAAANEVSPALARETVTVANDETPALARETATAANEVSPAPAWNEDADAGEPALLKPVEPLDEPQLYQMQFTTTEEHAELVERAQALLSHREAKLSLGELHLQAMRLLVEALEKQRFGAKAPARRPLAAPGIASSAPAGSSAESGAAAGSAPAAVQGISESSAASAAAPPSRSSSPPSRSSSPRQRGRHVPARLRRAVFERDAARCSFVDERGVRCRETHYLELHHRQPFARQGPHDLDNLTLRCAAHNALSAEEDFGREHVALKRDGGAHLSRRRAESG